MSSNNNGRQGTAFGEVVKDFLRKRNGKIVAGAVVFFGMCWGLHAAFSGGEKIEELTSEDAQEIICDSEALRKMPEKTRHRKLKAAGLAISNEFGRRIRRGNIPSPREGMARIGKLWGAYEKMSDADKAALRAGVEEGGRRHMLARQQERKAKVAEFFAASPEEQEHLLDEEIAKMEERRARMEKHRAEWEKQRAQNGDNKGDKGNGGGRPPHHAPSKEQREQFMRGHLDNSTPAERAQQQEYMRRLRERMAAKKK